MTSAMVTWWVTTSMWGFKLTRGSLDGLRKAGLPE